MKTLCYSTFSDKSLEKLYQSFSVRQKRSGLECFLITAIFFDIFTLIVPNGQDIIIFGTIGGFLIINCLLLIWCKKGFQNKGMWSVVPHLAFHLANGQILCGLFLNRYEITSRDSLGWFLLLTYLIYVTLPLRLPCCILLSCAAFLTYIVSLVGLSNSQHHFFEQQISNSILLITANILGLTSFLVSDKEQRQAFLETRQSLEMKLVIEEQSAEQERLLLSVLPEHVAVQMRQDLDQTDSQFKKIYMSRHENVSILYADIVGFTAISSTYSAQELVKMLNELFARFDKLAEKYHQLRIKILGDCYYCISGAPRERPDHAVLCVHMGLSMVKAIKYVQQTANSPVDMRVGIHTGAVLAGVLGQRQWQFDVYSKDVELANKMESTGLPGRVHISSTTLSFLNGEFEVEPAYGELKEEILKAEGLKTYFIVKVLKPFQNVENHNDSVIIGDEDSCVIPDLVSEVKDDETDKQLHKPTRQRQDSADFKIRLREELVNRDGHKELTKNTKFISLDFTDNHKDKAYRQQLETFASINLFMFLIVRLAIGATIFVILPKNMTLNISYLTENLLTIILLCLLMFETFIFPSNCWKNLKKSVTVRQLLSAICVLLLGSLNVIDSISCMNIHEASKNCTITQDLNDFCLYPSYFSYFTVIILIASSLPAYLSYIWKSLFLLIIVLAQSFTNIFILDKALDCEEARKQWISSTSGKYSLSALLFIVTLALIFLARYMEQVARVLFLWRCEVEEQRDFAEDMKRRNEALVYNILPSHVATHFMGNRKRKHDELYSQSYAEVGVLFASMPNFSEFYSEESINNQGLECLRFLNEVISDFDALLELPQFQDNIIKIKTIGSTYMAASGLNPSRQFRVDDPVTVRWAHLALLVEFALELKKALQGINEQSFNHFVLQMGINHGPLTAGVIGARKPHYDIWGNTVNVASRMESTGKSGHLQVTEETCEILRHFGYQFEQRGLISVKGKGQLMTYYLLGKDGKMTPPTAPVSPILSIVNAIENLNDDEESNDSPTSKSEEKTIIECCNNRIDDDIFSSDILDQSKEVEPLLLE